LVECILIGSKQLLLLLQVLSHQLRMGRVNLSGVSNHALTDSIFLAACSIGVLHADSCPPQFWGSNLGPQLQYLGMRDGAGLGIQVVDIRLRYLINPSLMRTMQCLR
jgi:hypothetical protein